VLLAILIIAYVLAFTYPFLFKVVVGFTGVFVLVCLIDAFLLYSTLNNINATRNAPDKLSLGDKWNIELIIHNTSSRKLHLEVIDELPRQLQTRNFSLSFQINANDQLNESYSVFPLERGAYDFGQLHVYLKNPFIGIFQVRKSFDCPLSLKVYPSFVQMRKYELQIFSRHSSLAGIRKVRKVGVNDEFEQIREYVTGDDYKSINWKATSRSNKLMVNQFKDTRSQQVYCIIDKGRAMKMPFEGLTLLDYAINASLVIGNIALKKDDKVGLVSFSNKMGSVLKAKNTSTQIGHIMEALYRQKTDFLEPNFEGLFYTLKHYEPRRSVLLFFTNFEHKDDLHRHLPYLKKINQKHLLVVIFFSNTEIEYTASMQARNVSDVYLKTFAQKAKLEKEMIRSELIQHGIQAVLTEPKKLSVNVLNKYLEIKAKGMQ